MPRAIRHLQVAVGDRLLFPGEFVEYDPAATNDAGWVQGIQGWPLMCSTLYAVSADGKAEAAIK